MGILQEQRERKTLKVNNSFTLADGLSTGIIYLDKGKDRFILDQDSVKALLPHLQKFAETGEL
jgi:hypothetical protein